MEGVFAPYHPLYTSVEGLEVRGGGDPPFPTPPTSPPSLTGGGGCCGKGGKALPLYSLAGGEGCWGVEAPPSMTGG